jgi:UDP:flavonoid glycosyltransferase YjiC (YdhE family)
MRVLFATTGNDGHFGPLRPFARAFADAGHEVAVAAPESYADRIGGGFRHQPFADAPEELIGPVMERLPSLPYEEADEVVIREVFARLDAQAALPGVVATMESWQPDLVLRESAELASMVAAERAGVPHVHVCIGMHEVADRFAEAIAEPLDELGRLAGLPQGRAAACLADELVLSSVPERLDAAAGKPGGDAFLRYHEPAAVETGDLPLVPFDADAPLVYVTFGSVTGSLPPFAGAFRAALDALADIDAGVVMTVGRRIDPDDLRPWPGNAHVEQWWPQDAILARASAMVGHGGFGTTMGALAAGVPQAVVPMFSFDQAVNGAHVAAVGAGIAVPIGPGSVARAASEVPRLLADPSYAEQSRAVAADLAALPRPREAVERLVSLVG